MADEPRQMEWAEPLPPDCPPTDAEPPNDQEFYRLAGTIPPRESDFYSFRELHPDQPLKYDECLERSCTLFDNYWACAEIAAKYSRRHGAKEVVRIRLPPESGVVLRTFKSRGHYSWWRAKGFDPVPWCQKADPPSI
jgi:hypothetical protein